jgi:hypothetical protein
VIEDFRWRRARQLVWWTVELLPADLRATALGELGAAGEGPPAAPHVEPVGDTLERLRGADTVLRADAALPSCPDWTGLAAAHAGEPFGRVRRRALIARRDCPDSFVNALLEPWDSLVAGRLTGRRVVPDELLRTVAERIGEIRPSLVRLMLSEHSAAEFIRAVPHLALLVDAVDGYDHNHGAQHRAFWVALGELLAAHCGTDRRRWLAAASNAAIWPGTFANLVRRLDAPNIRTDDPDPRVLAHAPDTVLADIIAALPDPEVGSHWFRRSRDARPLKSMLLARLVEAGVPARPVFALWVYGSHPSSEVRVWAHGHYEHLDTVNNGSAQYNVELRTGLAAKFPHQGAVTDLVAELRACSTAVQAEAVLATQASIPWTVLLDAHRAEPLPSVVACALASRSDFPAALVKALPEKLLELLAYQNPVTARAALADRSIRHRVGLINQLRARGTLADTELTATIRPARDLIDVLYYAAYHQRPDPLLDQYTSMIREAAESAAATESAPPGFWPTLLRLLATDDCTLPELLANAAATGAAPAT